MAMQSASTGNSAGTLRLALAQIAPVWLQREATLDKIIAQLPLARAQGADLICFGEALLPGYPFWIEHTDGARFNSALQKKLYAHYVEQAVCVEAGDLARLCRAAREQEMAVVLGVMERPAARGESVYCSAVYIDRSGCIANVHRKLMPTYEERLVWAQGDGHGLRTFALGRFTLGILNCWENWLPLARTALYAQGEDLHVSLWPGNPHNTRDLPRFIAKEARSYVVAISGLLRRDDIPDALPFAAELRAALPETLARGASCVAGPDGEWLLAPWLDEEGVRVVNIDHSRVREERQNLDVTGHYSRPDVLQLQLDRRRQQTLTSITDDLRADASGT